MVFMKFFARVRESYTHYRNVRAAAQILHHHLLEGTVTKVTLILYDTGSSITSFEGKDAQGLTWMRSSFSGIAGSAINAGYGNILMQIGKVSIGKGSYFILHGDGQENILLPMQEVIIACAHPRHKGLEWTREEILTDTLTGLKFTFSAQS